MRLVTSLLARAAGAATGVPLLVWPLLAASGWGAWGEIRALGLRAERAELRVEVADLRAAQDRARADTAAESARRTEAIQEVTRYANQYRARIEADRLGADRAHQQLQQRLTGAIAAARAAAAAGGAPAGDPIGVLADVLGRADERAGILAGYADQARAAGIACERAYNALTGP
jgi:hypothetical protein